MGCPVCCRKWLVRGLVFTLLGGFLAAGYLYQRWTNPAAVRRQVLAKLRELFPGAEVTLDSAHMRLLGGIALSELRLSRRGDEDKTEFAYFPSAVLFHDKEQILEGKFVLRKVELNRPRLHIIRNPGGIWNLAGIVAPQTSGAPGPPTVVIHHGSIIFEDRQNNPGNLPVEITDLELTLLHDSSSTFTIEGTGRCDLAGPVQVHGVWNSATPEASLALQAAQIPVGPRLVQRLAAYFPEIGDHAQQLTGQGSLRAELTYHPGSGRPLGYDIYWSLVEGKLLHPQLPLPLDHLEAAVRCHAGELTVEKLAARAGSAEVKLNHARVVRSAAGMNFEADGTVAHLPVSVGLFERLPEQVKKFQDLFQPAGPVSLTFHLVQQGGKWLNKDCAIFPEGMSGCFKGFKYPLDRIRGRLDIDLCARAVRAKLTGFTGAREVDISGDWKGAGADAAVDLHVQGKDIPLDEKLLQALPRSHESLARSFHPAGLGDFDIRIRHSPGRPAGEFNNHYQARIHHARMEWTEFPYLLGDVKGTLDIYPRHWEFGSFEGRRHGGLFWAQGRSLPPPPGRSPADAQIQIEITGKNVPLDADLKRALTPRENLVKAWEKFVPAGSMNFTAKIDRLPRQAQDLDVTVDVRGCTIVPQFFRYALNELSGQFRYAKNRVHLRNIRARHGKSAIAIPQGEVALYPGGGVYVRLPHLQAAPLVLDADFRQALPLPLKKVCEALEIKGPLQLDTELITSQTGEPGSLPVIYWNGLLKLQNASFQVGVPVEHVTGLVGCVGLHDCRQVQGINCNIELAKASLFNQPFHDVHTKLDVLKEAPDVIILGLKAPIFGGQISGPGRIELNSTLRYFLDLTATEVKLDEFGRQNIGRDAKLNGVVSGRLYLEGKGSGIESLEGNGSLEMPRGRLYNLPLLLDLLKFLGLRWPDQALFEQAHALYNIHGDRLSFRQLDLIGTVISLHGAGDVKLDGSDVRLDFIPVWGRIEQVLPAVWQNIPSAIGKNLLKIEMRGKLGKDKDIHFHKKPIPALVDPLKEMQDRLTGKNGQKSLVTGH
jgi:hypothetical protein